MSKVLCIPDVHLKPSVFRRATKILESGQADFAIQLGDLVDDWGCDTDCGLYVRTLDAAIKFQKQFPSTLWCMGNHDYGYWVPNMGVRESGHSELCEVDVYEKLRELESCGGKQENVHIVDGVIFSHAGLTDDWVQKQKSLVEYPGYEVTFEDLPDLVNHVSSEDLWQENSPIWVRPQYTGEIMFSDKMQVVGHTPVNKIRFVDNVLSTDVFSTDNTGFILGERKFAIVDTEKGTWEYAKEEDGRD